jgi:putative phosphoesterase
MLPKGFDNTVRIIVLSDSHGDYEQLAYIIGNHRGDADMFLHLGDGEEEFLELANVCPEKEMRCVRGNCDWHSSAQITGILQVYGKKIMYTHGHGYQVKNGLSILRSAAQGLGAKVVLFGHTHTALSSFEDGVYLINPGSIAVGRKRSYAIVDISEGDIKPRIIQL